MNTLQTKTYTLAPNLRLFVWQQGVLPRKTILSLPGGGWAPWTSPPTLGSLDTYVRAGYNVVIAQYPTLPDLFPVPEDGAYLACDWLEGQSWVSDLFVEGRSAGTQGALWILQGPRRNDKLRAISVAQAAAHYYPSMVQSTSGSLAGHLGGGKLSQVPLQTQIDASPATWLDTAPLFYDTPLQILTRPLTIGSGVVQELPWAQWIQGTAGKLLHNHDPQNSFGLKAQLLANGYSEGSAPAPRMVHLIFADTAEEIIEARLNWYEQW
jgi:hypothetical protein